MEYNEERDINFYEEDAKQDSKQEKKDSSNYLLSKWGIAAFMQTNIA